MTTANARISEIAFRIREMREIMGYDEATMATLTEVTPEEYVAYESGSVDLPFTFIHKCALAFDISITELLEGKFSRDLSDEKGIRRTVATLQRYGYEMGDIMGALREYRDRCEE